MENEGTTERLAEIGQFLAQIPYDPLPPLLLYADLHVNMLGLAVFLDRGNHVEYYDQLDQLTYPLLDLWDEWKPDERWAEIEYLLRDGKFTVNFIYPDQLDAGEDELVRRDRVVARYFGDKPIVYPPLLGNDEDDIPTFHL